VERTWAATWAHGGNGLPLGRAARPTSVDSWTIDADDPPLNHLPFEAAVTISPLNLEKSRAS
jgi:hypothetical protein